MCRQSTDGDPFSGGTRKPGNPRRLERRAEEKGAADLFRELQAVDPPSAERIDRNNEKRVLRALEIYYLTGETMTERLKRSRAGELPFQPVLIGLSFSDRQKLYAGLSKEWTK